MAKSGGAIELVELAYRAASSEASSWLERVVTSAITCLDHGADVFAYEYDTNQPYESWLSQPVIARGDPRVADTALGAFAHAPRSLSERIHKRAGAVTILSELIGHTPTEHATIGPHARDIAIGDMIGVNASDPSGRGTFFCATARARIARDPLRVRLFELLAAHLAAASRLRHALTTQALPEAVLTPDGTVVHASSPANDKLPELKYAARQIDRARVRAARADPEALESWRALVEGRWSLVDVIERDGKRFLFAHPNAPSASDPRRLTRLERTIAGYIAMGHSNKLIAYELGLSLGSISATAHRILKKFGVRTRVELVDRFALLTSGDTREIEISNVRLAVVTARDGALGTCLTEAERAVAALAARGHSNAVIARRRGTAARTVANQLASIFKKLRIRSRSELRLSQR